MKYENSHRIPELVRGYPQQVEDSILANRAIFRTVANTKATPALLREWLSLHVRDPAPLNVVGYVGRRASTHGYGVIEGNYEQT
jgi:hypothetical protein